MHLEILPSGLTLPNLVRLSVYQIQSVCIICKFSYLLKFICNHQILRELSRSFMHTYIGVNSLSCSVRSFWAGVEQSEAVFLCQLSYRVVQRTKRLSHCWPLQWGSLGKISLNTLKLIFSCRLYQDEFSGFKIMVYLKCVYTYLPSSSGSAFVNCLLDFMHITYYK